MQIVIDIPESYYEGVILDRILETTLDGILEAIKNGKILPDNATNGDVIKAMFPNIITEEFATIMHTSTKVTCCGDKHCNGAISYDFWKEWWNAPFKPQESEEV